MTAKNTIYGRSGCGCRSASDFAYRTNQPISRSRNVGYSGPHCEIGSAPEFSTPPYSLAMGYVLPQEWRNIYDADVGMARGTIFAELDKPWEVPAFAGSYCAKNGGCR